VTKNFETCKADTTAAKIICHGLFSIVLRSIIHKKRIQTVIPVENIISNKNVRKGKSLPNSKGCAFRKPKI
jgi:hypothetical protein